MLAFLGGLLAFLGGLLADSVINPILCKGKKNL